MVFGEMGTASERYAKTGERETRTLFQYKMSLKAGIDSNTR
jgi:hypothetical protein